HQAASSARDIVVGIRPESLALAAPDQDPAIDATVEVVELTGPELVVTATIGDQRLTASLPPRSRISAGMAQRFAADLHALHVFDRASGRRL
ncbi:MAG: TOBE domain-containing protein, partial [Alphaproteobacteria bacterium]